MKTCPFVSILSIKANARFFSIREKASRLPRRGAGSEVKGATFEQDVMPSATAPGAPSDPFFLGRRNPLGGTRPLNGATPRGSYSRRSGNPATYFCPFVYIRDQLPNSAINPTEGIF